MGNGVVQAVGERILIVDDDIAYCDAIADILAYAGFRTLKANSVDAAVAILAEITPDLILSDTMMPGTDGRALLRIVRGNCRLRAVPFVTVSARALPSHKSEAIAAGVDGFLAKPFTAAELLAEIGRQLNRSEGKAA
jgi:DNA-binding response OmpR family regulator